MSTFEDRLATALRAYAADQEAARDEGARRAGRRGEGAWRGAPGSSGEARQGRLTRAGSHHAGRGGARAAGGRRPRHRGVLVLVPVAVALAALVLLLPGGHKPAPASAAEFLRSAAVAAEQEAPLPAGSYLYVRREFRSTLALAPVKAGTEERWTRADGSGRTLVRNRSGRVIEDTRNKPGFRIGTETVQRLDDARGLLERQARRTIADNPGFDPAQLRAFTAYTILRDLLASPSSATLRAEAFRTLAATPGLRRAGDTVIARVGDVELRLTVKDGRVGALERRLLRRSAQIPGPPRVVDRSVVVERGAVGSSRARP